MTTFCSLNSRMQYFTRGCILHIGLTFTWLHMWCISSNNIFFNFLNMKIVKSNISKYPPTKVDIDKYCIQGDVTKALYCVTKHKSVKFAEILNCLNQVFLPLKYCFIRKLKFILASLIVPQLNSFREFQLPDHGIWSNL